MNFPIVHRSVGRRRCLNGRRVVGLAVDIIRPITDREARVENGTRATLLDEQAVVSTLEVLVAILL